MEVKKLPQNCCIPLGTTELRIKSHTIPKLRAVAKARKGRVQNS